MLSPAILGLGPGEIIILLLVVLILFGAAKLPIIGDSLGKGLRNFKKALKGEKDSEKKSQNEKNQKS